MQLDREVIVIHEQLAFWIGIATPLTLIGVLCLALRTAQSSADSDDEEDPASTPKKSVADGRSIERSSITPEARAARRDAPWTAP